MAFALEKIYTEEDYYSLPEDVRSELIDGYFYNMSAPSRIHQEILNYINNAIYNYIRANNGSCKVYPAPFAVNLYKDKKTIVEPDISVICDKSKLTDRGCSGAPDWIVEIVSPSNPSHDYIRKLNLYANAGVREYWIVNPMTELIYLYYFAENQFQAICHSFRDEVNGSIFGNFQICLKEFASGPTA